MIFRALTTRQRQILDLMAEGANAKQIGQIIGLTVGTVKKYRGEMYVRLGADNAAHAVAIAFKEGLIATALPDTPQPADAPVKARPNQSRRQFSRHYHQARHGAPAVSVH